MIYLTHVAFQVLHSERTKYADQKGVKLASVVKIYSNDSCEDFFVMTESQEEI